MTLERQWGDLGASNPARYRHSSALPQACRKSGFCTRCFASPIHSFHPIFCFVFVLRCPTNSVRDTVILFGLPLKAVPIKSAFILHLSDYFSLYFLLAIPVTPF